MPRLTNLLFCVLLAQIVPRCYQQNTYNFSPESRHMNLNEGESIQILFTEIGNQTEFGHCYIQSDIISHDYPILKPVENESSSAEAFSDDRFRPYDKSCGFWFYTIDDQTSLKWTITAFDNTTKTNFTEEVTLQFYYNLPLYSTNQLVLPSGAYINFFYNGDINLKSCFLTFDTNATVELDINSVKIYDNNNIFKSRILSLGGDRCGYKIANLAEGESTDFTLIATDAQNRLYRNTSLVVVTGNSYLKNRTVEARLGDSITIICGKESDTSANMDQKFCHLYNPQGVLLSYDHMCYYSLEIVTKEDLGTWRCIVGFDYIMDGLEFTTELVEKGREAIVPIKENIPEFLVLGCQLENFDRSGVSFCKFTRPDGKMFKITTKDANMYYNSFTADLENGRCSLEILKPLRDEDKGTWKCEIALLGETPGIFIDVEKSTTFSYNKEMKKNVHIGNKFTIDCLVPFPSDYCHIIAPNGTQFQPDSEYQISTGLCSLSIEKATATDNGTWSCAIAQTNGVPDEIITVEVSVIELKVIYADAEAVEKAEVELVCNTNGIPVEYCRFVNPSGKSYTLRHSNSTTNKIAYSGRGLEYGDCGLKISGVDYGDNGIWTCYISSGRSQKKTSLNNKIQLTVLSPSSAPSLAESVGIAGGVLIVLTLAGGFVFYKYSDKIKCWRKRDDATAQFHARDSNRSSTSGESVVLQVAEGNGYNTNNDSCVRRKSCSSTPRQ